MWIWVWR